MKREADIEGIFHLYEDSGKTCYVNSGYRPAHKIHDNYISSGEHQYVGVESVPLGGSAPAKLWLITPNVYPASIWVGREIEVSEGSHIVGKFTVTNVLNKQLLCAKEDYSPFWVLPPGLE